MSRVYTGSAANYMKYAGALGITAYPFSFMCWIKPDAVASGFFSYIEYKNNSSGGKMQIKTDSGNVAKVSVDQQYTNGTSTAGTLTKGSWQAVVVTVLENGSVGYYIDITGERKQSGGASGTYNGESSAELFVGIDSELSGVTAFDGKISHIAFWKSALTAPQVSALLAGTSAPSEVDVSNLLAYWPLTDASLVDTVGSKTLAVTGTVASDAADNPPVGAADQPGIRQPCYDPTGALYANGTVMTYAVFADKAAMSTGTRLAGGTATVAGGAGEIEIDIPALTIGTSYVVCAVDPTGYAALDTAVPAIDIGA